MKGTVTHHYYTPGRVRSRRRLPDLRQPSPPSAPNLKPQTCHLTAIQLNGLEKKRLKRTSVERLREKMTTQIRQIGTCHLPPAQRYS